MTRAYLGLGSNIGDRLGHLRAAVAYLRTGVSVTAVSDVFESEPVGGPPDQGDYYNAVVEVETDLSPHELLGLCRAAEAAEGRVRVERWGPRTLDVDILLYGDLRMEEKDLVIPHPRMAERPFVREPLRQVAPEAIPEAAPPSLPSFSVPAPSSSPGAVVAAKLRRVGTLEGDERHP